MSQTLGQGQRVIWSLWVAAVLAAVGGLLPLLFGGTSSRISGVILPFGIGAVALAACALLQTSSRTAISIVYLVAGLAIVYGLLSMFSLPIQLAASGSCPAVPEPCATGLPRPLSDGETSGIGSAAAFGLVALFLGFIGLVIHYRRTAIKPIGPPVRTIPPVAIHVTPPRVEAAPEGTPELPAPEEPPELPAHESSTPTT